METIRRRIRAAREAVGMTQAQLAERMSDTTDVHLHPSAIAKIELGPRVIAVDELVAIARSLGVTVGLLLDEQTDDKSGYRVGYQDGLLAAQQAVRALSVG